MTDIPIPPEVVEATAIAALFADCPKASEAYRASMWARYTEETRDKWRAIGREVAQTALAAWPGMRDWWYDGKPTIYLPLQPKDDA